MRPICDIKNKKKYQELYNKWKKNRTAIEFQNTHIYTSKSVWIVAQVSIFEKFDTIAKFSACHDFKKGGNL